VQAFFDAAICFFVPFMAASPLADRSAIDIFAVGKTIHICMLGVVTMEIMIVARYWTFWFGAVCVFSYFLIYPFVLLFPVFMQNVLDAWDMEHSGIGVNTMATPFFWIALITVYSMTFTVRYFERSLKWLFRPDKSMILAEWETFRAAPPSGKTAPATEPIFAVEDPSAVRSLVESFLVSDSLFTLCFLVLLEEVSQCTWGCRAYIGLTSSQRRWDFLNRSNLATWW
jgi:hypothetical protein